MTQTFEITLADEEAALLHDYNSGTDLMTTHSAHHILAKVAKAIPEPTLPAMMANFWGGWWSSTPTEKTTQAYRMKILLSKFDLIQRPELSDRMAEWLKNPLASYYPAAELKEWLAREVFDL